MNADSPVKPIQSKLPMMPGNLSLSMQSHFMSPFAPTGNKDDSFMLL
jgi:hypothetical protein